MYDKILAHANCVVNIDVNFEHINNPSDSSTTEYEIGAIEIANYHDGESVAIECVKCNEVLMDFNRPEDETITNGGE